MILLIWEIIPENTLIYLFENLSPEEEVSILKCNGIYVGGDTENDNVKWLCSFLTDKKPIYDALEVDKILTLKPKDTINVVVSGVFNE